MPCTHTLRGVKGVKLGKAPGPLLHPQPRNKNQQQLTLTKLTALTRVEAPHTAATIATAAGASIAKGEASWCAVLTSVSKDRA
jgi:hypothetical protein